MSNATTLSPALLSLALEALSEACFNNGQHEFGEVLAEVEEACFDFGFDVTDLNRGRVVAALEWARHGLGSARNRAVAEDLFVAVTGITRA
jgi:hypothetical protein